jgi:1,5-anhydro-D-fructose reductase (1,5-anhydro-D-mannitol-forming)
MTLGWGIVGTGTVADRFIAPAIKEQPDSRIVAAFDVDEGRLGAYCKAHGIGRSYGKIERLLEDPEVDIVYIASPNSIHPPQTIAALKAGKHVLCEKPLALTLADGRTMVTTARETGRLLGVGYHMRHKPSNKAARKLIAEGRLGRVFMAQVERGSSKAGYPYDTWRAQPQLVGGGTVFNQALHTIDNLRYITSRNIVEISARVDKKPIEDIFAAVCAMDDGTIALLSSHQMYPDTRPDWVVYGDKGWLKGVGAAYGKPGDYLELYEPSGVTTFPGATRSPYIDEVNDFVLAVQEKAPLDGDGEDGLQAVAVVEAVYRSLREGCTIKVEPIW